MEDRKTIVIVDDDALIRVTLANMCKELGVTVVGVAKNAAKADELLSISAPDLVLMDVRLGGERDGVDIANAHYASLPGSRVVYITGSGDPDTINRIHQNHPHHILVKPIMMEQLRSAIA